MDQNLELFHLQKILQNGLETDLCAGDDYRGIMDVTLERPIRSNILWRCGGTHNKGAVDSHNRVRLCSFRKVLRYITSNRDHKKSGVPLPINAGL